MAQKSRELRPGDRSSTFAGRRKGTCVRDADLGEVLSEHRGRPFDLFGIAAALLLVGVLTAFIVRSPCLAMLSAVAGLVSLVIVARWTPRRVLLCDYGLEVHWYLRRPWQVRFDDCVEVFREWSLRTSDTLQTGVSDYALVLVDHTKRRLRLRPSSLEGAEHLFTRLERLVVYPGLRDRREAFERGEDVRFGDQILVNERALRIAGVWSEWSDVREVELSPALLIVRFHGRRRRVLRVARIPFVWGLVGILRRKGLRPKLFDGFREV